ncbi:M66 family metalloprotease [Pseudomonas promysalinigenes]|uniref:M66 family metalloprotease n=1 Tax=Pseudomonas promysalinigenes TaxID=485898 RepID=A0ABY6ALQ8_9PSED|nr:M66 family metalloprotease [Pseudomonas promysalinigenes]UXH40611.1 M66 family metalloprotease [Pseudomonas promysalinigenes]
MSDESVLTVVNGELVLRPYIGSLSQRFRIQNQGDGSIGIRTAADHNTAVTMSETGVWLSEYKGNTWQSLVLDNHVDGSVTIMNMYIPVELQATTLGVVPKSVNTGSLARRFYVEHVNDTVVFRKLSQVFNTDERVNDLRGALQGSVRFAQSQVIPVTPKSGDQQPHLVSRRKTLVMIELFRPAEEVLAYVYDEQSKPVGTLHMRAPNLLPNTIYHSDGVFENDDDAVLSSPVHTVDSQEELDGFSQVQVAERHALSDSYERVEVQLSDHAWLPEMHLPAVGSGKLRSVLVNNKTQHAITVYYDGEAVPVLKGACVKFCAVEGRWANSVAFDNRVLTYSEDAWSEVMPASWVRPGMSIHFYAGGVSGVLDNIKVGGASELLVNTIDIGMLTPPRNQYAFATTPGAHREYYQNIPVARMVVSDYQALHLTEVMLPDGTLLTDFDPSHGDAHNGTMREQTGKILVSLGMNHANYGIHTSPGDNQWSPYTAAQLTAHNSRGKYANGVVVHGLSGGGSMVTLDASLGNELSHEFGHNYSLGHYPGEFDGSIHRPAHAPNSTWGWDMDLNRFIPNFAPEVTHEENCLEGQCQAPFFGRRFGSDAMAGGYPMGSLNRFTLHTPYVATRIQQFMESKAVFSEDSPTGFRKWDPATHSMEAYVNSVDVMDHVVLSNDDLSELNIALRLWPGFMVKVRMSDGDWAPRIVVPPATPHSRSLFSVEHNAGYDTELRINGQNVTIGRGFSKIYVAEGASWVEAKFLDASMSRVTASNDDLGQARLASLLDRYRVLGIAMRDGDWADNIYVPPAAASNKGRILQIDHAASYPTNLNINGLIVPISRGMKKYYESDGSMWRERPQFVDKAVAQKPHAHGVPVTTVIGYYDPENILPAYIYPALHGAYGYVYEPDEATRRVKVWQLRLTSEGRVSTFELPSYRLSAKVMNKFHVNVRASSKPLQVAIIYDGRIIKSADLSPAERPLTYTVNGE